MPVPTFPTPPPATLGAGATWSSGVIPAPDGAAVVAAATLDQTGSLVVQRYADPKGTVPVGVTAASTQAMTASAPAFAGSADGIPFGSYTVSVTNSSGTLANLSNVYTRYNFP